MDEASGSIGLEVQSSTLIISITSFDRQKGHYCFGLAQLTRHRIERHLIHMSKIVATIFDICIKK